MRHREKWLVKGKGMLRLAMVVYRHETQSEVTRTRERAGPGSPWWCTDMRQIVK